MSTPLWQPSAAMIEKSQLTRFIHFINQSHNLALKNYSQLYHWSIHETESFWAAIWEFNEVIASKKWEQVLVEPQKMPGAKWFSGAKLNFAENLLRYRDDHVALIFNNEANERRSMSFQELHWEVSKLAAALRAAGVNANDRIAAFMPNLPETVIIMLATTSIGAIFSSCSPDFGSQGVFDRFDQIQPKILFTSDGYFYNGKAYDSLEKIQDLAAKIPSLEKLVIVPYLQKNLATPTFNNAILYADFLIAEPPPLSFAQLPFDHPIYILYSSGTTGSPKCIVHGAGGVLLQHFKELKLHTDLCREDVFFYFTTCGWMMWNWLISGLALGTTLVLYDGSPFYPKHPCLFNLIERERVSVFGTSAKYLSALEKAKLEPRKTHDLTALRSILSTGSPLLPMNFDYVYQSIKTDICLSSISGGTDIVSCFALGNPILPVYRGELQCRGLGLKVEVYDDAGKSVIQEKGELVCTAPFPVMPIYFWNDADGSKYQAAYFEKFPGVWAHGDYAEITAHEGMIIYGRSDALLKPAGVRIGTAEIYRQVEKIPAIEESLVIGQDWKQDIRIVLFVKLRPNLSLTNELKEEIKTSIRKNASPHHVPAKIVQIPEIPKTINGKIVELAVRDVVHGRTVKNKEALANPEALEFFKNIAELQT